MESNTTQSNIFEKYPSLKAFAERMAEVADDILSKAVAESSDENREYEADIDKYNIPGEPIISPVLLDNMLTDSGIVEDTILHDDSIELYLTEQAVNTRYREHYDANWTTEIEIICAKHALWIYGENGGERADFSNCLVMPEENPNTFFMISLIIQQLYREILSVADENGGKLKNRCVFFCDEFGSATRS